VAILYRDIPSKVMSKAWIGITYAMATTFVLYVIGRYGSISQYYIAVEVPTLAMVMYVLSVDPTLRWRVPFLWVLTAGGIWGLAQEGDSLSVVTEAFPVTATIVFSYWTYRAVYGTVSEAYSAEKRSEAISVLLATWGATLQLGLIGAGILLPLLDSYVESSLTADTLASIIRGIRHTSPVYWGPSWMLLLGVVILAGLRLKTDPYVPPEFRTILPIISTNQFIQIPANIVRYPVWIVVMVLGFVKHFVKQVLLSLHVFIDRWVGRLVLIAIGVLAPTLALGGANWMVLEMCSRVHSRLSGEAPAWITDTWRLTVIHILMLAGLCLFSFGCACLGLRIGSYRVRDAIEIIRHEWACRIWPAAETMGKAFCLYGFLVVAVPVAALMPGPPAAGRLSGFYLTILISLFAYQVFSQRARDVTTRWIEWLRH